TIEELLLSFKATEDPNTSHLPVVGHPVQRMKAMLHNQAIEWILNQQQQLDTAYDIGSCLNGMPDTMLRKVQTDTHISFREKRAYLRTYNIFKLHPAALKRARINP